MSTPDDQTPGETPPPNRNQLAALRRETRQNRGISLALAVIDLAILGVLVYALLK